MTFHFANHLNEDSINSIATKFGFRNKQYVERFIMDFEMQYRIIKEMECITRGGMCVPFHTPETDAKRLSIDIDLITNLGKKETDVNIKKIDQNFSEVNITQFNPKKPHPIDELLSYKVEFTSCFGNVTSVKIDFLCGVNITLPKVSIPPGYELFAFSTDYPVEVLTRGALIADKLTTLALDKIGLPSDNGDIPKQMYDIACQLRLANENDLKEAFQTFEIFTKYKVDIFQKTPKYTVDEIVTRIDESLKNFIRFDKTMLALTGDQGKKYDGFQSTYLSSKRRYKKTEHLTNILLIHLFTKYILQYLSKTTPIDNTAKNFHDKIAEVIQIENDPLTTIRTKRTILLTSLPQIIRDRRNILKGAPLAHVFLINELCE